ncbi:MAG: hypothetical protein K6C68_06015 [Ruminococcus sp.]|nr:hypothetical protein [Ruminococcus sp.]
MGFGIIMFLAAVSLAIILANECGKNKRMKKFYDYLYFRNRISKHEHDSVISGIGSPYDPPPMQQQPFMPPPQNIPQPDTAPAAAVTENTAAQKPAPAAAADIAKDTAVIPEQPAAMPQPQPIPQPAPMPQPMPMPQPAPMPQQMQGVPNIPQQSFGQQPLPPRPQYNMPTNFPPRPEPRFKEAKPVNTAAVMLFIGVAFVILSGVIFSTAQWHTMSDLQRVGMVGLASAFFFGVSAFAHKKLKLISTGLAFYMLGGVFTGLSFLSLGYFELMGEWFSTSGDGKAALYAVFSLIVTAFFAGASRIYKKTAFTHMSLYGGAVSLSLIAFQIADTPETWSLMLNFVAALLIYITYRGAKLMGEQNDPIFRRFAIVISAVYALTAVPSLLDNLADGWTVPQLMTVGLWAAELIFYAVKLDHPVIRGFAPFVLLMLIAEAAAAIDLGDVEEAHALKCVIAAIVMLVAFTAFRMVRKLASGFSDSAFIGGIFITALVCTADSTAMATVIFLMSFAAMAAMSHGLGGVPETEQKVFRALSAVPALITAGLAAMFLYDNLLPELFDTGRFESIEEHPFRYPSPLKAFTYSALLLLTAFFYRFSGRIGLKLRTAVSDLLLTAAAVIAAFSCYPYKGYIGGPSGYAAAAALLTALLISAYVFEHKPKLHAVTYIMRRAYPVAVMYLAYTISVLSEEIYFRTCAADADSRLILRSAFFMVMSAGVMVGFLNIRKIRTVFADFALPILIGIQCAELSDASSEMSLMTAAVAAWSALSVLMLYEGLERSESGHLVVIRAFSPLMMFAAKEDLHSILFAYAKIDGHWATALISAAMLAAAAVFAMLTRRARAGGELRKPDLRLFAQHQYIWAAAAGFMLLTSSEDMTHTGSTHIVLIVVLCIALALYLLSESFRNDLPAAFPLIVVYPAAFRLAVLPTAEHDSIVMCRYIIGVTVFTVYIILSRIFHKRGFIEKKRNELFRIDLPAMASVIGIIMVITEHSAMIAEKTAWFTALIMGSVFTLNLMRENTTEKQNKTFVTISSAFICMLIWVQPFGKIENVFILWKLNILAIVLFGIIYRSIWKNGNETIKNVTFGVFVTAFAALLTDALVHQSLANTITVLSVTLTIMLISFAVKSGRWFVISAASFLGLTLYITRDFLAAVQWWVYLLAAGILLIVIASANEYLKSHGETLKTKMMKAKDHWKN